MSNAYTRYKYTFSIVLACVTAGCASTPEINETSFKTKITDTGLKHFELKFSRQTPERDLSLDAVHRQERLERSRQKPKTIERALNKIALAHIESNGYCTSGYWVIESDTLSRAASLRGECNELASKQDRQNFPNTIKRW
ncbi:MAG: hypothetical protein ACI9Y1_001396 [Lentisphaeria bacterium]|jgi:hypothetical protein